MGVGIITNDQGQAAMYDSVSGFAFGPIFEGYANADEFLDWLREDGHRWAAADNRRPLILGDRGRDPREWGETDLVAIISEWERQRAEEAS